MKDKQQLLENSFLKQLAGNFSRSPIQLNKLLESDAELVRLDESKVLAITADTIVEEISSGLYTNPKQIGWMTVMVNLSDMAAVGARVLGLLLAQSLPDDYSDEHLLKIQEGIEAACQETQTFILGGDTNQSGEMQMGGTAVGVIEDNVLITRKGAQSGDWLYVSGPMGLGNAFAFERLLGSSGQISYFPVARLKEGVVVRHFGTSCIDSSDGFFPALSNLLEINNLSATITLSPTSFTHLTAQELSNNSDLPPWFFLAGPHGKFELVFTIPPENKAAFESAAEKIDWKPIVVGRLTEENRSYFSLPGQEKSFSPFEISNLYIESGGDPERYLYLLAKKQAQWQLP